MVASTPIYGFPFETPSDKPGVTLTGGTGGVEAGILAEKVENQLVVTDDNVQTLEDRIAALENAPGWRTLFRGGFLTNGEVVPITPGAYDMVRIRCAGNLEGGAGTVGLQINEDDTAALHESHYTAFNPSVPEFNEGVSIDATSWQVGKWNSNRGSYLELTLTATDLFSTIPWSGISSQTSDNTSIRRNTIHGGRLNDTRLLESVRFFGLGTGIDIGSNFRVWIEGHVP